MDYQLVFDTATQGYTTWRAALLPGCIAVGAGLLALISSVGKSSAELGRARLYRRLSGSVAVLAAFGFGVILTMSWRDYERLRTALASGAYRTVEGQVSSFVPERAEGHPREMFRVGDTQFVYSTSYVTSAFHWTAGRGGPMRDGLWVRIADVDGAIVRLEIAR